MEQIVISGMEGSYELEEGAAANMLCRVFKAPDRESLPEKIRSRYLEDGASKSFAKRRAEGIGLSDRVWDLREGCRREIEGAFGAALHDGLPAGSVAKRVKQYLNEPDRLYRRVRDEKGILHPSKRMALYHPGRGVYRSSYKNALRMVVTETNKAYHAADHERWQKMDFVVGIEVKLSGNHTVMGPKGKPVRFTDICDELQGKYPKDFQFSGWHPFCRCQALPILKSEEEMAADLERDLADEEPLPAEESRNAVKELPTAFTDWMGENSDRIKKATQKGTLPSFLRDNQEMLDGVLKAEDKKEPKQNKATSIAPPHIEEYVPHNNRRIMVSPRHGKDELDSNLKLAETMYEILGETVYLLPNINPKGPDAHLRSEYIPKGVKKDKNADFLCANRIWDGKECSFENTPKEWNKIKSTLENHFKKAKKQADNFIIQVPVWLEEEMFTTIVLNYLSLSKNDRWIIICKENGYGRLYKNTIGQ